MIDPPQIVALAAQKLAAIRLTIPRAQMREVMGPGIGELLSTVAAQGLQPTGPWLTHHHRLDPEVFDFSIAVPVERDPAPQGRVQPEALPAGRVARTTYRGPYEELGAAWGQFMAWIAEQGHQPAAELWEVYAVGPETGPDASRYETILHRPLVD